MVQRTVLGSASGALVYQPSTENLSPATEKGLPEIPVRPTFLSFSLTVETACSLTSELSRHDGRARRARLATHRTGSYDFCP